MSKVMVTNVDNDDKYEVIIYDNSESKIFEMKVDEFHIELFSNKEV